jgi:hypothetical protein
MDSPTGGSAGSAVIAWLALDGAEKGMVVNSISAEASKFICSRLRSARGEDEETRPGISDRGAGHQRGWSVEVGVGIAQTGL